MIPSVEDDGRRISTTPFPRGNIEELATRGLTLKGQNSRTLIQCLLEFFTECTWGFSMSRYVGLTASILCCALFLATPSANADQLVKVVDHPIVSTQSLDLTEIRRRVVLIASKRGWTIEADGQQQFKATIAAGGGQYQAVVAITYTDKAYSITLVESKGFGQRGDTINGRANRWIRNLERDIELILANPA